MEQSLGENGLQNLNPMYFWKYVRADKNRITPRVIIQVEKNIDFFYIAEQAHQWEFLLLTNNFLQDPHFPNVKIMWGDSLTPEQRYKLYSSADYVLSDIEKPELWLPAMFCGATPIYDLEQLESVVEKTEPLTIVERIENWENAENTLTFLSTSAIKEV